MLIMMGFEYRLHYIKRKGTFKWKGMPLPVLVLHNSIGAVIAISEIGKFRRTGYIILQQPAVQGYPRDLNRPFSCIYIMIFGMTISIKVIFCCI